VKIVWSPEAADDLDGAVEYLAQDSPAAAAKLGHGILALVDRLAAEPLDGPKHTLKNGQTVRGWPFPPFRVYYQRTDDALLIVRVYHQKREPIAR
jgi:plasmid stabilization system protein ParE